MGKFGKMTRYAFISHLESFMKKLLKNPLKADTDDFLKHYGIDGPVAIKMLMKRSNPDDEFSSVILRTEKIKDNGYDEDGNRKKDSFIVTYKIPRKDYTRKMRNLFISLFESNIIEDSPITEQALNEGAWGYGILDNDSALDIQSNFAAQCLSVLISNVQNIIVSDTNPNSASELWSNLGVLIDFLKKYKDDEIQFNDLYNQAVDLATSRLNILLTNSQFINMWSEPKSIKESIRKLLDKMSDLRYQREIMNVDDPNKIDPLGSQRSAQRALNEMDGGGEIASPGATADASNGAFDTVSGKGVGKKKGDNEVIKREIYLTSEQVEYLKEALGGKGSGDFTYDACPFKTDRDGFFDETMDHKKMMEKSWKGE